MNYIKIILSISLPPILNDKNTLEIDIVEIKDYQIYYIVYYQGKLLHYIYVEKDNKYYIWLKNIRKLDSVQARELYEVLHQTLQNTKLDQKEKAIIEYSLFKLFEKLNINILDINLSTAIKYYTLESAKKFASNPLQSSKETLSNIIDMLIPDTIENSFKNITSSISHLFKSIPFLLLFVSTILIYKTLK